jgi:hypothetical protein
MMVLELCRDQRSRCTECRQPIAKGSVRFGSSLMMEDITWSHALCRAISRPASVLSALGEWRGPQLEAALLSAIATTATKDKVRNVIWRHSIESRCLLELAGTNRYALVTLVRETPLAIVGPLDEVIASVPDEDLEAVVAAAVSAGKQLAR